MEKEHLAKITLRIFHEVVTKLVNPEYKLPQGGEPLRLITSALNRLEKKFGTVTCQRLVDYVVCSVYPFKDRGSKWRINQVFGPKSLERFNSDRGRVYFEDKWLSGENLSRAFLISMALDRSGHPKAKFIYVPSEEGTKLRLLNTDAGFAICQFSTLGWSPVSEACSHCQFTKDCKQETQKKFPEIFRLRIEYGR